VNSQVAIKWARQVPSVHQRARRLADVARFARDMHAEDARHELPPAVFGSEKRPRPAPYILSDGQICQIIQLAAGITPDGLVIRCSKYRKVDWLRCMRRLEPGSNAICSTGDPTHLSTITYLSRGNQERLTAERRASVNTCDSYAYAFRLLLEYASKQLKVAPSRLELEQVDAPLVVGFLNHLEKTRSNGASSRNVARTTREIAEKLGSQG